MTRACLPPETDRYRRHQLVFEVVPSLALAVVTRQWVLVAVAGAICLPAVRSTWVHWARHGVGLLPLGAAVVLVSPWGAAAMAGMWAAGCALGIGRLAMAGTGGPPADDRGAAPARPPAQRGPRTRT